MVKSSLFRSVGSWISCALIAFLGVTARAADKPAKVNRAPAAAKKDVARVAPKAIPATGRPQVMTYAELMAYPLEKREAYLDKIEAALNRLERSAHEADHAAAAKVAAAAPGLVERMFAGVYQCMIPKAGAAENCFKCIHSNYRFETAMQARLACPRFGGYYNLCMPNEPPVRFTGTNPIPFQPPPPQTIEPPHSGIPIPPNVVIPQGPPIRLPGGPDDPEPLPPIDGVTPPPTRPPPSAGGYQPLQNDPQTGQLPPPTSADLPNQGPPMVVRCYDRAGTASTVAHPIGGGRYHCDHGMVPLGCAGQAPSRYVHEDATTTDWYNCGTPGVKPTLMDGSNRQVLNPTEAMNPQQTNVGPAAGQSPAPGVTTGPNPQYSPNEADPTRTRAMAGFEDFYKEAENDPNCRMPPGTRQRCQRAPQGQRRVGEPCGNGLMASRYQNFGTASRPRIFCAPVQVACYGNEGDLQTGAACNGAAASNTFRCPAGHTVCNPEFGRRREGHGANAGRGGQDQSNGAFCAPAGGRGAQSASAVCSELRRTYTRRHGQRPNHALQGHGNAGHNEQRFNTSVAGQFDQICRGQGGPTRANCEFCHVAEHEVRVARHALSGRCEATGPDARRPAFGPETAAPPVQ